MSTELMPFDFDGAEVRVVMVEGDPWFVAADVARILGFQDAYYLTRGLDNYDKVPRIVGTPGGEQEMTTVSEAGLYAAILRSRVEGARRFKHWVTHDVLPSIRRTGAYSATPALTEDQIVAQALQITSRRVEQLETRVAELEPKADTFDAFLSSVGDYSVNEAAKILARDDNILTGQGRLFGFMQRLGWIYRDAKNRPIPYQAQIEAGRLAARAQFHYHPETGEKIPDPPQIRVTAKGLDALRTKYLAATA